MNARRLGDTTLDQEDSMPTQTKTKTQATTFNQTVNAPVKHVFEAFTNATLICEWFCNDAQLEAKPGGRAYLYWRDPSFYAMGEFLEVSQNERIKLRWQDKDTPQAQDVYLQFLEYGGQTDVSVVFDGSVSDQLAQRWKRGLNVLRSTQETGYHLDDLERPMLGVMAGAIITAANAAAHKVPVEYGVVVSGVVPGHAAERAGLQANDVIVRFDGLDVRPQERNLFAVLAQRKVGDVIEVEYVRDGQVQTVQVELMSRPMFDYPSLAELADQMVQPFIEANRELEALFAGVSEHDANAKPDPERWSANEVVAHLINTERDAQTFIASLAVGTELEVFSGNLDARVAATARRYGTTAALLKALKDTHAETSEMIRQLPKAFLERRASVVRLQLSAQVAAFHTRHHFAQITRALQDARA